MAAIFRGVRLNVPSVYKPGDGLYYQSFPYNCHFVKYFNLYTDEELEFKVLKFNVDCGKWFTETKVATNVCYTFKELKSDKKYILKNCSGASKELVTDSSGSVEINIECDGKQRWRLISSDR